MSGGGVRDVNVRPSDDVQGFIKTLALAAGFLLSILCLVAIAVFKPQDGPQTEEVVQLLSQIAIGSGIGLGMMRVADLVANILNVRSFTQTGMAQQTGTAPQTLPAPIMQVPSNLTPTPAAAPPPAPLPAVTTP